MRIKKVVFSDIDGTIYDYPNFIENQYANEIKEFTNKNDIQVVLNTGNGLNPKVTKLAELVGVKYVILGNGTNVYDLEEKKYIFSHYLEAEKVKEIFKLAQKHNWMVYSVSDNKHLVWNPHKEIAEMYLDFIGISKFDNNGEQIYEKINKIELISQNNLSNGMKEKIDELNLDIEIAQLSSHIEITNKGFNKGTGVKYMCDNILDIDIAHAMTIGDSGNDITMFELTNYSYALANAQKSALDKAKYYTSAVEQKGFLEGVIDYNYRMRLIMETEEKRLRYETQKAKGRY